MYLTGDPHTLGVTHLTLALAIVTREIWIGSRVTRFFRVYDSVTTHAHNTRALSALRVTDDTGHLAIGALLCLKVSVIASLFTINHAISTER
jgi:cytochrome b